MQENLDANTARTYALVGTVFCALAAILGVVVLIIGMFVASWFFYPWQPWSGPSSISLIILLPIGLIFILSLFFAGLAYSTYKKIEQGRYADARTTTLALGIFGLFPLFGLFLGGIFFLLCYGKLGSVLTMQTRTFPPTPIPSTISTHPVSPTIPQTASSTFKAPTSKNICSRCGQPILRDDQYCPNCGFELVK